MTANFYGLNHNLKIADGEWFDMENLTSDHLPVAAVRNKRSRLIRREAGQDLNQAIALSTCNVGENTERMPVYLTEDGILCVADRYEFDLKPYGIKTEGSKRIAEMGAYLIVLPDWIYVNTATISESSGNYDIGRADKKVTWPKNENVEYVMKITVCDIEGINANYVSYSRPGQMSDDQPKNGETWFFYGDEDENATFMRFDEQAEEWYAIEAYLKIALYERESETGEIKEIFMEGLDDLQTGDVVQMEGDAVPEQLRKYFSQPISVAGVSTETKTVSYGKKKNGIKGFWVKGIFQGISGATVTLSSDQAFTVKRAIPSMDVDTIFESGNRLWGAAIRYNDDGVLINEIYCSARGDISRWYMGKSDDYDAPGTFSVGEGGEWTGGIDYGGVPTFFKENIMYRVFGSGGSFSIDETPCEGVEGKAKMTLAEVNGAIYFKAKSHVMRYDGSVPQAISNPVDGLIPKEVWWIGKKLGDKYALATDGDDLFLLDTQKGVWTRERKKFLLMASGGNNVFAIEDGNLIALNPLTRLGDEAGEIMTWEQDPREVQWYAESGIIGLETPDEKYLTRLAVRLKLEEKAHVRVLIEYDSSGEWMPIMATEFVGMRTVMVSVNPHKYDHMRYRLEGEGGCQIFSVTKTLEKAGRR